MLVFSELLVEIGGLMGVKGGTYCEHGSKFSNLSFLADLMKILKEMVVETLEGMLIELLWNDFGNMGKPQFIIRFSFTGPIKYRTSSVFPQ